MISWRTPLLAAVSFSLMGQARRDQYQPLIRALALTDAQMSRLQQEQGDAIRTGILDGAHQTKLAEFANVMQYFGTSAGAVVMGLMDAREWPWGWGCPLPFSIGIYAKEFDLSADQVHRLDRLAQEVRQQAIDQLMKNANRYWKLWQAGTPPDEAAVEAETSQLVKQRDGARPPRDLAMAVLDDSQRAKFAAFHAGLELAREAVELHLLRTPVDGVEVLCH